MCRKRIVPLLLIFSIILLGCLRSAKNTTDDIQADIASHILRFHILANSDSTEDQQQKLYLRDILLHATKPYINDCTTKEEVISALSPHLSKLEQIAEQALLDNGCDLPVIITLENTFFPTKAYADMVFPCGNYDALRVEIGSATGHNWWCVMFPRLCFDDLTYGYVPAESVSQLQEVLTPKSFRQISRPTALDNTTSAPKVILRFRIVDFFKSLFE